jgi:hypothetical protein
MINIQYKERMYAFHTNDRYINYLQLPILILARCDIKADYKLSYLITMPNEKNG